MALGKAGRQIVFSLINLSCIIMKKRIIRIAIVVILILLIPIMMMLFGVDGWNWGPGDFVAMGALLFGAGLVIDFAVRKIANLKYRIFAIIAIVAIFLLIWAELAVDAVSQALTRFF
jgi:peptidoglycan/LPS O-acetylase OafA/YrhL